MRLLELHKPAEISAFRTQKKYWRDEDLIYDTMAKYGFRFAGEGASAHVFIHDSYPYALKIFNKDNAYVSWFNFCRENQDNPFVPKIRGKVLKIKNGVYACRVEKLDNWNFSKISLNDASKIFLDALKKGVFVHRRTDEIDFSKYIGLDKNLDKVLKFFYKTLSMPVNDFRNDVVLDLHHNNFMLRGNQIVIIDPFA